MRTIRDCNVCVVGGAGFLGSHMVDHLIDDRNCKVLVVDNLAAGRKEFIHPRAKFEYHDITESESHLYKLFKSAQIDYVFNYAAYPYVPTSFARPLHVFNVNAFGALKVINAAQEAGCRGILQVSSAEIYGGLPTDEKPSSYDSVRIDEDDDVCPHSSYGASKAAIDALVPIRWREAQTPVIAMRQFNCIGERDFAHPYVVPEIIMQIHKYKLASKSSQPVVYLGNNSYRDFLYAGDAVKMAAELLEHGDFGEVYNVGSEHGMRIYDLANLIGGLMGCSRIEIIKDASRVRPWEIWHLLADCGKLYETIKYRPRASIAEALERTITSISEEGWKLSW